VILVADHILGSRGCQNNLQAVVLDIFSCAALAAGLAMPRLAWRLKNRPLSSIRPLQSTSSVADITRVVLCSVYRRVTSKKETELASPGASVDWPDDVKVRSMIAHWKQHPLKDAWKESACTLRYAISGAEFACIPSQKLKELGTTRQLHLHVRELMKLEKHMSLKLDYVDSRSFDGLNRAPHTVRCEDSGRVHRYLRGAILEVMVHP
jgi:hypothetical protein